MPSSISLLNNFLNKQHQLRIDKHALKGTKCGRTIDQIRNRNMTARSSSASSIPAGIKIQKIAMVAPSLDILGGQGVQAYDLSAALEREGFKVLFIAVNPRFPFGLGWLRRIPWLRTVLNQLLYISSLSKLRHVDAVHIFSASYWSFLLAPVPAILTARWFGKRIILNYHSGEASDHLLHWGRRVHPWLRMVDEIVVPSQYLQEIFTEHGYVTQVIKNIINTSSFRYRPRKPLQANLLSTRNLESHYGVINTLQAFAIFKKQCPDALLTIAGYGRELDRLQCWVAAQKLNGVRFIGRVEPKVMPQVYDEADIFLNSSTVDNQPVSILEAFAAGLAVVSTPTGDIPAMVIDKTTGLIVPHNDPQAMADAISLLLQHPQQTAQMTESARNEVEKYTWSRVCDEWARLYHQDTP